MRLNAANALTIPDINVGRMFTLLYWVNVEFLNWTAIQPTAGQNSRQIIVKAPAPIAVTPSGIITAFKSLQSLKALGIIEATPFGHQYTQQFICSGSRSVLMRQNFSNWVPG